MVMVGRDNLWERQSMGVLYYRVGRALARQSRQYLHPVGRALARQPVAQAAAAIAIALPDQAAINKAKGKT